MVDGVNGHIGQVAVKHVEVVQEQEKENATILFQHLEEATVQDLPLIKEPAIQMNVNS